VVALRALDPQLAEDQARVMAHAAFGLLNSTPHSIRPTARSATPEVSREVLRSMTIAALSGRT